MFIILKLKKPSQETSKLPPGPRGLPLVGYLPFLSSNLHHDFRQLASRYGPIVKVQLGSRLCFVISSPSLAKEVTRNQDTIFANHDMTVALDIATNGGLDIAFAPNGSYWQKVRKIFVQEMLSKSSLDATHDLRKIGVRKAVHYVFSKVGAGTAVEIGELVFLTVADVIMNMLWGGSKNEEDEQRKFCAEFMAVVEKTMDLLSKPNVSDLFPVIAKFDLQGIAKEMNSVSQSFDKILDRIINTSILKKNNDDATKRDFIQILLQLRENEETDKQIGRTEIKSILTDIVIAGTETTAATIEWVMTESVHNRDVMQKVQKELELVVGLNNIVEEFHLPKLQYLNAALMETLRLHPVVPLLVPRKPSQSCTLSGYTIPKDSKIFINVWEMQRDPLIWENPLEFKPERFLDKPPAAGKWDFRGNNFQFLPFGSGRRVCAGIPLAEKMLMYLLASLLHSFDWQPTETNKEIDLKEKFGLVMRKSKPLLAIPTKRLPNSDLY